MKSTALKMVETLLKNVSDQDTYETLEAIVRELRKPEPSILKAQELLAKQPLLGGCDDHRRHAYSIIQEIINEVNVS